MKRITMIMSLIAAMMLSNYLYADVLAIGKPAPEFALPDQHNHVHHIADYQGKWLVLYFYPKNDTPGCTTEACAFRDEYKVISALNTQVLGVSVDNQDSHAAFAKKYSLPFPLLADINGEVADKYGSLVSLGPIQFAKRHTVIIDTEGNIRKIYRDVNASRHSKEVIADLKSLRAQQAAR